ncbi:hypothetical protein Taro_056288 [Colocasia esculenta]|uniref:Transcription repressor n=1 Tax=Colocasia esculenta TaxID=4460 RepID=A0A843XWV0_COLES|nr:hypothetical protein [Colocasia esculenta]
MSSSGRRRFPVRLRCPKVVDVGCSCRGTKLSSFFTFSLLKYKSKPSCPLSKHQYHNPLSSSYYAPSSSSTTTAATSPWATTSHHPSSLSTTTASFYGEDAPSPYSHSTWSRNDVKQLGAPKKKKKQPLCTRGTTGGKGEWAGDSVAVVKDSDDPYLDFRESMLQMILEKEIYAWEDLLELLNSFLALNAPCHHDLILRAFAEIWNGVFSSSTSCPPASGYASSHVAGPAMHGPHGRPRRRRHDHAGGRRQRPHSLT